MTWHIFVLTAAAFAAASVAAGDAAQQPKQHFAGWMGVYPAMKNFDRKFTAPSVKNDKKHPVYSQTAEYEWVGGADRHYTVMLARDAEFKNHYSDAEVQKGDLAPAKVQVGEFKGWLWKFPEAPQKGMRPQRERLVVLLGDDRILLLESKGYGPGIDDLTKVAKLFDLEKIKAALDNPPLAGSRRTVEPFKHLKIGMPYSEVAAWVGNADKDIGSGIHVMQYRLDDGSDVLLGFPDFNKMIYAKHRGADGKTVDLAK